MNWSAPISNDEAARRAAGRRHYNARRTEEMLLRRREVVEMLRYNGHGWGSQAAIARALGVSQATISRDVDAILRGDFHACPTCDRVLDRTEWEHLASRGRAMLTPDGVLAVNGRSRRSTASTEPSSVSAIDVLRVAGHLPEEDETPQP